ncbi:pro-sigmaK processing inhibitor BofA family protein [Paenibacillus alvei]|uniref:Pro-sigmaK processing inhibitor BofA family protein n=1 Tax=Paenibacillus alvei TaxID=44250 RepID=A0AAP7DKB8_PAEAL|nr:MULTISPECIES: pro-sigmaK processing inhibitor BofA family protein [Paenibacillus]EJW18972.1 sigmaK-factor processing regulatory protein BofA [Paenibacillus alvei DSM 29]MCY7487175.1 pro-sigmaK processing inhibitor BofA family protein [Paenibacillus alvei]MCY9539330.1 pro-sigmaK processing inhibitor BofA family protein [Paenibacillus alvei]MCY9705995.1 pro-sigmaK processing inhibitor BofA family protein [Paenibacillus alvei]MCY9736705.1 pro-sigmaK processing inhibitor BofA family protein [Pa
MKILLLVLLIASIAGLLLVLVRQRLAWRGILTFLLHGVSAFALLYLVNTTGWVAGVQVPINPVTLTGVGLLGIPGLALVISLKMVGI